MSSSYRDAVRAPKPVGVKKPEKTFSRDQMRSPSPPGRKGKGIASMPQSPRLRGRDTRGVLRDKPAVAVPAELVQETLEQHDVGRKNATELTRIYEGLDR